MINIIICEDNEKDRKKTLKIVKKFFKDRNIDHKIYIFNDYNEKFNAIMKSNMPFKLYLLDIETPTKSGIDVAREIRNKEFESAILFLTAHEELLNTVAKEELTIISFVNKFVNFDDKLVSGLHKALKFLNRKQIIKIVDKNISYTIDIDKILYLTKDSFERKTIIKTDYDEIKVNKTLDYVRKLLDDRFVQTHRACYINDDRKVKIDLKNRIITFDNGETIDLLSNKYRKELSS